MNNEEKKLSETESVEEVTATNGEAKKQLPLGALIGIIAGAVAVVVAVVLIILFAGGNDMPKCDGHIDADDDYLCDKCGEHFDDGDEAVIPEKDKINVTFTVRLDDGTALAGVKFILTRGANTVELVSGADGTVVGSLDAGTYYITYDHDTLPEYCWGETPGVKIDKETKTAEILVVDNRPNGTPEKPYPTSGEAIEINISSGEELYYSCRGTSLRYVIVNSADLVINYNGETYTAVDGVVTVGVSSTDVETPTIFSVKNISDSAVTATMEIYAPLGSYDNPIELTGNNIEVDIADGKTIYYAYKADKDGIVVITSPTEGNEILISRNIIKITDGVEEIVSTITAESSGSNAGYIYVSKGDDIRIGVSYVEPEKDESDKDDAKADSQENGDSSDVPVINTVELSFNLYAATEEDPAPVLNNEIYIRLDAGASVVFSAEEGKTVSVDSENSISVTYNGESIFVGEDFVITGETKLSITNSTDTLAIFTLKLN